MFRKLALAAFLTILAMAVAACGSASDTADDTAANDSASREEAAPELDVVIDEPGDVTVRKRRIVVAGTAQPAEAEVSLNGHPVRVGSDGAWEKVVHVELGENPINVEAELPGSTQRANDSISVTRKRTAAERARYIEAQRRKREERRAALRANATWIEPKLLQKDPERFAGDQVAMSGEIFQIQEGGDNFFLMNTECETEYDITICDGPTVHVAYNFSTNKTEDDLVTVYGTVLGGLDYDTAMGGSNFVGSIEAEIIE